MAAFTSTMQRHKLILRVVLFIEFISTCQVNTNEHQPSAYVFTPVDVSQILDHSCFVGISTNALPELRSVVLEIKNAFLADDGVVVGDLDINTFRWPSGKEMKIKKFDGTSKKELVVFSKRKPDRTCLSTGSLGPTMPEVEMYNGMMKTDLIVDFINHKCETYRTSKGQISFEGQHREEILHSLFHVENVSNVNMGKLFKGKSSPYCTNDSCEDGHRTEPTSYNENSYNRIKTCEKVPYPTSSEFFHNYLKLSKPVIFTGAMYHWLAMQKWTNQYLRDNYGNHSVHIKLTPSGEFEGVDSANHFENYDSFKIPGYIINQLHFPDLVVVRPASVTMKLSQFLDLVESVSNKSRTGISAYLEYSSIADSIPELEEDVEEMEFLNKMLDLKHKNIWLSDGNTLGKLHFDPFDNFLCQISGRKQVLLFEPHNNTRLYEAHIPEAMLSYNQTAGKFSKKKLVDTTSMVMSPVDILKPNFERFPRLADVYPLNCTIDEGEVLFMPAFWWHEVQSYPNVKQGRNLAVNFWYDPFLVKEFPCQDCKLDVNPKYRHLL